MKTLGIHLVSPHCTQFCYYSITQRSWCHVPQRHTRAMSLFPELSSGAAGAAAVATSRILHLQVTYRGPVTVIKPLHSEIWSLAAKSRSGRDPKKTRRRISRSLWQRKWLTYWVTDSYVIRRSDNCLVFNARSRLVGNVCRYPQCYCCAWLIDRFYNYFVLYCWNCIVFTKTSHEEELEPRKPLLQLAT